MAVKFEMLQSTVIVSATTLENRFLDSKLQLANNGQSEFCGKLKPYCFELRSDGIVSREEESHYVLGYN